MNLKLNKLKCRFHVTELPYIGHVLTTNGVKPDQTKVDVIKNMSAPTSTGELRRFLGYMNYLAKFMPNLSSESEPLRKLIHKDADFVWGDEQEKVFQKMKELTKSDQVLGYYDPMQMQVLLV